MNSGFEIGRVTEDEYAPFYKPYIAMVPEENVLQALRFQGGELAAFFRSIPEDQGNVRHAPYTWSVKEVIGHITDAERVFSYRAMSIARGETQSLPPFDENAYVKVAGFDRQRLGALVDQFDAVRQSTLLLFENLPPEAWPRRGTANHVAVTVRALAYIAVGHARHHSSILRKRLA